MRKANFEALRLFSVFAIIYMHTYGEFMNQYQLSAFNKNFFIMENSLFNVGVSCLMLISGYFGVKLKVKKLCDMQLQFLCYSILAFGVAFLSSDWQYLSRFNKLSFFLPIISKRNWFVTSYVWIVILSPFINTMVEKISRKNFKALLISLILLFYGIPTFFYYELMQDSGKGIVTLFILYLIGRYIALYHKNRYSLKRLFGFFLVSVSGTLFLNIMGEKIGISLAFSRDCSITILISAILLFLFVKQINIGEKKGKIINFFASCSFAILMGESVIKWIVQKTPLNILLKCGEKCINNEIFCVIIVVYVVVVILAGALLEYLRRGILQKILDKISDKETKILQKAFNYVNDRLLD